MCTSFRWIDADIGTYIFKFKSQEIEDIKKKRKVCVAYTPGKIELKGTCESDISETVREIQQLAESVSIKSKFFNQIEIDTLTDEIEFEQFYRDGTQVATCTTAGAKTKSTFKYKGLQVWLVNTSVGNIKEAHVVVPVGPKFFAQCGTAQHIIKTYGFEDNLKKMQDTHTRKPTLPIFYTSELGLNGHVLQLDDWYNNKEKYVKPVKNFCTELEKVLRSADKKNAETIALPLEIGEKCPVAEIATFYCKTIISCVAKQDFRYIKNIYLCVLKEELLEQIDEIIFDNFGQKVASTSKFRLSTDESSFQGTYSVDGSVAIKVEKDLMDTSVVIEMRLVKDTFLLPSPGVQTDKNNIENDLMQSLYDLGTCDIQHTQTADDGLFRYTLTFTPKQDKLNSNYVPLLAKNFFNVTRSYNVNTLKIAIRSPKSIGDVSCNSFAKDMVQSVILHGKRVGIKTVTFIVNTQYEQYVDMFRLLYAGYLSQKKKIRRSQQKIVRSIIGKVWMSKLRIISTMTEVPMSGIVISYGYPQKKKQDGDIYKGGPADVLVRKTPSSDACLTKENIFIRVDQTSKAIDGNVKEQFTTALEYAIRERNAQMLSIVLVEGEFHDNLHAVTQLLEVIRLACETGRTPAQIDVVLNSKTMADLLKQEQSLSCGRLFDLKIVDNKSKLLKGSTISICSSTDKKVEEVFTTFEKYLELKPPVPPPRGSSEISNGGSIGRREKVSSQIRKSVSEVFDSNKQNTSLSSFSDTSQKQDNSGQNLAQQRGQNVTETDENRPGFDSNSKQEEDEEDEYARVRDKIFVNFFKELGCGAFSTVYEGRLGSNDGMPVAVKKVNCKSRDGAKASEDEFKRNCREFKILEILEQKRHSNVVGYYLTERKKEFLFIAFELCQGTLEDYVSDNNNTLRSAFPPTRVNECMADGLEYLHSKYIVHRDLKPENVFLKICGGKIENVVLGDFGSSKCTVNQQFSLSGTPGTFGYISQEVLKAINQYNGDPSKEFLTSSSDIFALGILFYYVLTNGQHPFGNHHESNKNILDGHDPSLSELTDGQYTSLRLITEMLSHDARQRPSAKSVCDHPAIWSPRYTLDTLKMWSDNFESAIRDSNHRLRQKHLEDLSVIPKDDWYGMLPKGMRTYLGTFRATTNRHTVRHLLRVIRNTETHLLDLPHEVRTDLGHTPQQRLKLWLSISPKLIVHLTNKLGLPNALQFPVSKK